MTNGNLSDELIAHSVTRDEEQMFKPHDGSTVRVMIGSWTGNGTSTIMQQLPDLPQLWSHRRDDILMSTVRLESRWSQAVGLAIMKAVSKEWDVRGKVSPLRLEKARNRIRGVNYIGEFSQGMADYLLRDNGWWMEIVRPTSQPTGVIGLKYLPSNRCMPTGYEKIPMVYWDRLGHPHEMQDYQVMRFVDMPDGLNPLGVGMCSASRAYNDIRNYAAVARYRLEKITGNRPLAVHFLTGLSPQQVKGPLQDSAQQKEADNIIAFGGVVLVPFIQRGDISHVEIPISSLPDGFSNKEEIQSTAIAYADALPFVTYLDLMPMTGQRAGSGAQSQVVDDQSANKEPLLREQELKYNDAEVFKLMPEGVTFFYIRNDMSEREREAKIALAFTTAAGKLVTDCQLEPQAALQWLSDNNILSNNTPPSGEYATLGDVEAVETEGQPFPIAATPPAPMLPAANKVATKEQLDGLANELRTIIRSNHDIPNERISEVLTEHLQHV